MPKALSRSLISVSDKTAFSSEFNLSKMALGVLEGAINPTQELISKSATPLSINVGTCGNELARWPLDTATACNLPDLTWKYNF